MDLDELPAAFHFCFMPTTTSFAQFLEAEMVDGDDYEDIVALHGFAEVGACDPEGDYSIESLSGGRLLIRGRSETQLLLASDRAREEFKRVLEEFPTKDGFEGDVQSWVGYRRAMDNPNA